ncbi:MAG: ABC transporter ATP-binding protein [Oleiphilaceae bacterium]|nr:ABC transporter ATP-binding protein [Oleiphilaceae bacterium]
MTNALEIVSLNKTYDNGHVALKDVSLNVKKGDFFALLGPNGAGKSTTLGIVSSLVNKTSGKVKIFDYDLDRELEKAKTCLGVVPQEVNFNQFEKVEHILVTQAGYYGIPASEAKQTAEVYLKSLGLWEKRNEPARMLSGGMKRRVMIARALIHKPKLLILDEPTAGVDIELRRSMWKFLQEINDAGTTIILTTHYLEEAEELCRNIAIIDKGEILENSPKHELLSKLTKQTYVFETTPPLSKAPELDGYDTALTYDGAIELTVEQGRDLGTFFDAVKDEDWKVLGIRNKSNRLEELFLSLVSSSQDLNSKEQTK